MTVLALVGIVLAVVLWDALPAFAARTPVEVTGAVPDAYELSFSPTVASHAGSRPYLADRPLIQEIMESAQPVTDPQGALHTLRWEVPGNFNGTGGTWELVVNTTAKKI
jgi:hypothetical protein